MNVVIEFLGNGVTFQLKLKISPCLVTYILYYLDNKVYDSKELKYFYKGEYVFGLSRFWNLGHLRCTHSTLVSELKKECAI